MITQVMVPHNSYISLDERLLELGCTVQTKEINGQLYQVVTLPVHVTTGSVTESQPVWSKYPFCLESPLSYPTSLIDAVDDREAAKEKHKKTYWQKFNSQAYGNKRKKSK